MIGQVGGLKVQRVDNDVGPISIGFSTNGIRGELGNVGSMDKNLIEIDSSGLNLSLLNTLKATPTAIFTSIAVNPTLNKARGGI
jgi:hypothetical protein